MNHQSILLGAALAVAIATTVVSGCDRRNTGTPSPKGSSNGGALLANPPAPLPGAETLTAPGGRREHLIQVAMGASNKKPNHADGPRQSK